MPDTGNTDGNTDVVDSGDHFDPDNRAWRRLSTVLGEHFDVIDWTRADGRPVLVNLIDLASGDIVTLAVMDSLEIRDPYALLAVSTGMGLALHGPFDGDTAAAGYAPRLASADSTVARTHPVRLHHPDQPALPDDAWLSLPADLARHGHPALADARAAALLLLDRTHARLAAVGPFPAYAAVDAWRPTPDLDAAVERHIVGLHQPPPDSDAAWMPAA